jgi:hypothetical protein
MQTIKCYLAPFGCALFVFTFSAISPTLATGQDNGGKVLPAHATGPGR